MNGVPSNRIAPGQRGVVVASVTPGSTAAENGLVAGDLITFVQRQQVTTPEDAMARIDRLRMEGGKRILFLVQGQDGRHWLTLPLVDEDAPLEASANGAADQGHAAGSNPGMSASAGGANSSRTAAPAMKAGVETHSASGTRANP